MLDLVKDASQNDLILCLISGGGSSLLPLPLDDISIEDLKILNSLLLTCGASIHEINLVRKHVSGIKGGKLSKIIHDSSNALLITLLISDVVGNKLESIASGPTMPDSSTCKDTLEILKKYMIFEKTPSSIISTLKRGLHDKVFETPKLGDECFERSRNYMIGNILPAVDAIISFLRSEDFEPIYISDSIGGEARVFGNKLHAIISQKVINFKENGNFIKKLALIGSGELTVTLKGDGIGGRNQEMLLSFLLTLLNKAIKHDFNIISVNLDGIDGNSDAMGAMVDNHIMKEMIQKNINPRDFLTRNDSNTFFKNLEGEIITGYTGCNVNDLILVLLMY